MAKEIVKKKSIGAIAFLVGFVLALILGVFWNFLTDYQGIITALLVLIGIVVGFLNVTGKETKDFLMTGAILIVVSAFGKEALGGVLNNMLVYILNALLVLFVPATLIVAIKSVLAIAKD